MFKQKFWQVFNIQIYEWTIFWFNKSDTHFRKKAYFVLLSVESTIDFIKRFVSIYIKSELFKTNSIW